MRGLHGCRSGIGPAQIVHRVREQTVERRVTYHAGENCDAEDLQNCLNDEVEHDGEQALVIGKAVADGHRRVEKQAGDEQADEQQRENLQREGDTVGHVKAVQLSEQADYAFKQVSRSAAPPDHNRHSQRIGEKGEDKKERGGDEFRPEEAVDARGEREHQVTLVGEEVLVEALDHQDGGEDRHAEDGQHIYDEQQRIERLEEDRHVRRAQNQVTHADKDRQQQHRAEQRGHQTARGAEFMFDQFSQHLNTSRKSASTDWPRVSRISSQLSCRLIFP